MLLIRRSSIRARIEPKENLLSTRSWQPRTFPDRPSDAWVQRNNGSQILDDTLTWGILFDDSVGEVHILIHLVIVETGSG